MASKKDNPGGRPLKFPTLAALVKAVDGYFKKCDKDGDPYLVTGLALALNTTRETLLDYEERDKFSDTIKKAKLKIHYYAEKKLFRNGPVTGVIFNLKNNHGWKDEKNLNHNGGGGMKALLDSMEDEDEE